MIGTRSIAVGLALLLASPAQADEGGIDFARMPVGCMIHSEDTTGNRWIEVYVGPVGAGYRTRTYEGPARAGRLDRLISTITYNADGFMTRRVWADGNWESFTPFSCFSRPGDCRYEYRTADGAKETFVGKVKPTAKGYVSSGGFKGQPPFTPTTVVRGRFGNTESYREGDTSYRVVKYENCGD